MPLKTLSNLTSPWHHSLLLLFFLTSPWHPGPLIDLKHTKYSIPTEGLGTHPSLCLEDLPPDTCTSHPMFQSYLCSHSHSTRSSSLATVFKWYPSMLCLSWSLSPPALSYTDGYTDRLWFFLWSVSLKETRLFYTPGAQMSCFVLLSSAPPPNSS